MVTCRKSILAFFFFSAGLALMTVQKTSLFAAIRSILHEDVSQEEGYAILTVVLLPPYVVSTILTVWNVSFFSKSSSTSQTPPVMSVLLGLFAAVIEAGCVVCFTTQVMAVLPVFLGVLALHGTLGISCLLSFVRKGMKSPNKADIPGMDEKILPDDESTMCCSGARIMASALCVLAYPAVGFFLYGMGLATPVTSFCLAVIPSMLGLIWTKEVQEFINDPNGSGSLRYQRFTFLYGLIKVIGIVGFLLLEFHCLRSVADSRDILSLYRSGFDNILENDFVYIPVVVNIITGLLGFSLSFLSLTLWIPVFGAVLPSLFSTISSAILCVSLGPEMYNIDELTFFGPFSQYLICSSILTWSWAWPYVSRASVFVRKPHCLLTPYRWLFLNYEWNPLFSDQKFILSYDTCRTSKIGKDAQKVKDRVYICTTMYREAAYEIERLLLSLEETANSPCLKDVHLESNIFMDNGCNGNSLNEFASVLIGLLVSKLGIDLNEMKCWSTPYGIQLMCQLSSGLPMYIHLKDPKKVKSKKRWSQTMYIEYIMKYKKAKWRYDCDYSELKQSIFRNIPSLIGKTNGIILKNATTYGSSKLPDFSLFRVESDLGFSSNAESSSRQSDSSSQEQASGSSKDSSDVDSLGADDKGSQGFVNHAFHMDGTEQEDHSADNGQETNPPKNQYNSFNDHALVDDDHTYILATDADMDFKGTAVKELLDLCNSDKRVGAACGRTYPIGKKCSAVVWHQVFEYAKDFWMIKNAQNVIGSVSCCPGCFSMYRASAVRQVMSKFTRPTRSPFCVYVKDTGEDRWMATLMMIKGWHMRYSPFADNTTYCPDTFQEYYKQRKRWILSDMANAILVMQNLIRLIRNNECFSLGYVIYLVNMLINNVITPGTAIVMITAGLELVFSIPYLYTTIPLALAVNAYAVLCTWLTGRNQGILTSAMTAVMGTLFASVAIFGTYKIASEMAAEANAGNFHFQEHYVILLLAFSLMYAAFMHPRETYQFVYGLAYLFIFPAMHILLPIYSIANIVDQSWGTRDSNTAKHTKISFVPKLKKLKRRRKKKEEEKEDTTMDINEIVAPLLTDMAQEDGDAKEEHAFWENLISTTMGVNVNLGTKKEELDERLRVFRNRSLTGFMLANAFWLSMLSYFYLGIDSPLSRLNIYGIISGFLYGFTLVIQTVGLTVGRAEQVIVRVARYVYGHHAPYWVNERQINKIH